ncbi:hypothetical protein BDQ17DRAFT_1453196 [Cyathus striatus]|nr:hypothetical protein BDQ17DRAFT_1453196 [Cyathus striatus]
MVLAPQVNIVDAIDLTRWINLNAARLPLQLTHLKISTRIWLEERFIFSLLDALSHGSAPLKVFVLDGIMEGSLELFDRISASCPQLLGLTINRRENFHQRQCHPATWPHATWEYASHFAGFQRLEYFAWNLQVDPNFGLTPASMVYLEEGGNPRWSEYKDFYEDNNHAAYPFAAHCPTLKSFVINSKRHGPGGRPNVAALFTARSTATSSFGLLNGMKSAKGDEEMGY